MCKRLHVQYPLFLPDINETRIFSKGFLNTLKLSNFMKIRLVRAELFHVDGRT